MQRVERKDREGMQKMGREGRRGKAREEGEKGREWMGPRVYLYIFFRIIYSVLSNNTLALENSNYSAPVVSSPASNSTFCMNFCPLYRKPAEDPAQHAKNYY